MNKQLFADLSLLLVAFIWGSTFVMVQSAIEFIPPLLFNGIRFFLAATPLAIFLMFTRSKLTKKGLIHGMILGIFLFIGYGFQTLGLLYTTPSKAGFVTGLSVVLVPFLVYLLVKKKPSFGALIGSLLAVTGLYLLMTGHTQSFNKGDALVFICAFGFAFHIILTDIFTKKNSLFVITTVQLFTVSILSSVCSLVFEKPFISIHSNMIYKKDVISVLLITAILATLFAFIIQTFAQRFTSPSRVAIIFTMEPVFAALCSYFWIGELLGPWAIIGCLFIALGMLLSELPLKNLIFKIRKKRKDSFSS
ncbi:DMT family transporter [Rossellomorea aquimaris]|uniref:DMT family transporter n=1 Tax=Rossellomorea aquimaris TaxID=189382 RepID=UPI0007D0AA38|nr:DMT family transporter [Rossellomorea aquimaris]